MGATHRLHHQTRETVSPTAVHRVDAPRLLTEFSLLRSPAIALLRSITTQMCVCPVCATAARGDRLRQIVYPEALFAERVGQQPPRSVGGPIRGAGGDGG